MRFTFCSVMNWDKTNLIQAVRSRVNPTTVLPTDDHYKTRGRKRPAPSKEELVDNRLKRSRFKCLDSFVIFGDCCYNAMNIVWSLLPFLTFSQLVTAITRTYPIWPDLTTLSLYFSDITDTNGEIQKKSRSWQDKFSESSRKVRIFVNRNTC